MAPIAIKEAIHPEHKVWLWFADLIGYDSE